MRGLSPVAASGGHSSSRCAGLSPWQPLLLRSTGSRRAGSVVVAHGPRCSAACGIFQTRARTRVPCIGRQTLNHCATREAHPIVFLIFIPINFSLLESGDTYHSFNSLTHSFIYLFTHSCLLLPSFLLPPSCLSFINSFNHPFI